ncbi:MAG TPA: histidine kinase [Campylobacterales bacterium]|nr:histidine kinase [Campylobacterales bacterium]
MDKIELKISRNDWLYIILIGALFGFFIALVFYFLNPQLQNLSTLLFSVGTSVMIALFASLLITISNNYILPKVNPNFWYIISFLFSFASGMLGFSISYLIGSWYALEITNLIAPWWLWMGITLGFLTFLIGLILHQFISMKYKHEVIKTQTVQSRLRALENELNPHFLFNALNSVSELVYIDAKKAESAILNISHFLRNAINQESLIPLGLELEMVNTYVEIENIRFDNQIKLTIGMEKELEIVLIPKFSIQLLVENAIKHGYNQNALEIHINAYHKSIIVSNNGKITPKIVYGTGLKNLEDRLKLLEVGSLTYKHNNALTEFSIDLGEVK